MGIPKNAHSEIVQKKLLLRLPMERSGLASCITEPQGKA